MRPALPVLGDGARSLDPSVCPFFRYEHEGTLVAPLQVPDDGNRCAAIGVARPQSLRQQELVCLKSAHADCPRYLRGAMTVRTKPPRRRPPVPRATVAALMILVLSAGISFGFVVQRGGIDLPVAGADAVATGVAEVGSSSPAVSEPPMTPAPTVSQAASSAVEATPSPTLEPTDSPSPSPTLKPTPTPTLSPTPEPTPSPTSDRYKLLDPCPDKADCYIYTIRSGDNLYSIANYFGISMSTIYNWNPKYANGAHLRPGDQIRMPPPTR
jgi:LysM repeat protein